jgi:hypothetical protein
MRKNRLLSLFLALVMLFGVVSAFGGAAMAAALSGDVSVSPGYPKVGDTVTATLSGGVAGIPASRLHYQWQKYDVNSEKYVSVSGATSRTYMIGESGVFRLVVTADGYDGEIYSNTAEASSSNPIGSRFSGDIYLPSTSPGYYSVAAEPIIWNYGSENIKSENAKLVLTSGDVNAFYIENYSGSILPWGSGSLGFHIIANRGLPAGNYNATATLYYDRDGSGWAYDYEVQESCRVSFSVSNNVVQYTIKVINGKVDGKDSVTGGYGHRFRIEADNPPSGKEFYKWEAVEGRIDNLDVQSNAWSSSHVYISLRNSDLTFRATYKTQGTWVVSFDANGGSGTQADIEVKKGEKLTLPKCTFTPPAGMIFAGWNIGSGSEQPGASGAITKDTVIKATWKTAPRETITDAINVTVTAPKISASPDFNASVNSSKCELQNVDDTSNTLVYMIDGSSQMTSFNTFQSGHFYRAMVWINAKSASDRIYVFPDNVNEINVLINGKKANVDRLSDTLIRASYDFTPEAATPLTGSVTVSQTNTSSGITLTANLSGAAANIPADKLHYDWRYVVTTDVYGRIRPTGGTDRTLTLPHGDYSTRRYFVYVTADGYEGYLQSGYVKIDAGSSSYPKGDVDRSGQVGNSDLILVARHVVNLITLTGEQFTLGDMDDDNQITNTDIILVARKIVGL